MIYPISDEVTARLDTAFTYHPPFGDQAERYGLIRDYAKMIATCLCAQCPQSRELALALTHLEEMVFWANASIARNERPNK